MPFAPPDRMRLVIIAYLCSSIILFGNDLSARALIDVEKRAENSAQELTRNHNSASLLRKAVEDQLAVVTFHIKTHAGLYVFSKIDNEKLFKHLDIAEGQIRGTMKNLPQTNETRKLGYELLEDMLNKTSYGTQSDALSQRQQRYNDWLFALIEANYQDSPDSEEEIRQYAEWLHYRADSYRENPNKEQLEYRIRHGKQAVKIWKKYAMVADNQAFAARNLSASLQTLAESMLKASPPEELELALSYASERVSLGEKWIVDRGDPWDGWYLSGDIIQLSKLVLTRAETDKNEPARAKGTEWKNLGIDLRKRYPKRPEPPGD